MPSFMCLINLSDVLDHGKMVGIVRVEDGRHRHLTRFLVHILWSFAKGIGGWLIANFKPWETLTQPAVGTKENRLTYRISLHYCLGMFKIIYPKRKHPQVSFFKRTLNIYLHLLFLACVFSCGEFPSAVDEIQRWFISDAIEQQFPGCPEQFGAVHVLQGWLVIVCDGQLMSRFHQKWVSPEPWRWILLSKLPPKIGEGFMEFKCSDLFCIILLRLLRVSSPEANQCTTPTVPIYILTCQSLTVQSSEAFTSQSAPYHDKERRWAKSTFETRQKERGASSYRTTIEVGGGFNSFDSFVTLDHLQWDLCKHESIECNGHLLTWSVPSFSSNKTQWDFSGTRRWNRFGQLGCI